MPIILSAILPKAMDFDDFHLVEIWWSISNPWWQSVSKRVRSPSTPAPLPMPRPLSRIPSRGGRVEGRAVKERERRFGLKARVSERARHPRNVWESPGGGRAVKERKRRSGPSARARAPPEGRVDLVEGDARSLLEHSAGTSYSFRRA